MQAAGGGAGSRGNKAENKAGSSSDTAKQVRHGTASAMHGWPCVSDSTFMTGIRQAQHPASWDRFQFNQSIKHNQTQNPTCMLADLTADFHMLVADYLECASTQTKGVLLRTKPSARLPTLCSTQPPETAGHARATSSSFTCCLQQHILWFVGHAA